MTRHEAKQWRPKLEAWTRLTQEAKELSAGMERLRVYNGNTSEVRPAVVRIGSTRRGDVLLHSLLSDHEISLALLPALEEKRQAVLAAMEAL